MVTFEVKTTAASTGKMSWELIEYYKSKKVEKPRIIRRKNIRKLKEIVRVKHT